MDGPLGRGFRFGFGDPFREGFHIPLKWAFEVLVARRLANSLFQTASVVVADEETDRFLVPLRIGCQPAQPLEEDLGVRVGAVQKGYARLDRNGAKITGTVGQVDTDESFCHGSAQGETVSR